MVNPRELCDQHLLGEHVELHMLEGSLRAGRSIKGFVDQGLVAPHLAVKRHAQLVAEFRRRGWKSGYNHKTPLGGLDFPKLGKVDPELNRRVLAQRCAECRHRQRKPQPLTARL